MKAVAHPYLDGVKCREDGAVWVPARGPGKGHWTFGCRKPDGYFVVGIARKRLLVHRLICEAFHGLCPPDRTDVDHLDRDPANNRPENLRWCNRSENLCNRAVYAQCGVSSTKNTAAYQRTRYANDPEFRERRREYNRARRAKKKGGKV